MDRSKKSVVVKHFGGYEALEVREFQLPPLEGNVEVDVKYCGLNFADLYTRQGLIPRDVPFVLGMECCGIIKAVGFESSDYKVGAKVICYNYNGGLYRDVVRVPASECYLIPDDVEFEAGAALFVNYLTAYFAVLESGNLRPNQNVFIQSLAGGVGWAATQLARTVPNVTIFGTASSGKQEHLVKNGVDHILSYHDLDAEINKLCPLGFDLILENQSGQVRSVLEKHLKPLGRMVLLGANAVITNEKKLSVFSLMKMWFSMKNISPVALIMNNHTVCGLHLGLLAEKEGGRVREALRCVLDLLRRGEVCPKIDSVWDFGDVVEATKVLAERRNVGKVLLRV